MIPRRDRPGRRGSAPRLRYGDGVSSAAPKWAIDDPRYVLPEKHHVYNSIEGLMHHFKLIMEGAKVPPPKRSSGTKSRRKSR